MTRRRVTPPISPASCSRVHRGQGRGAQQQKSIFEALAQVTQRRVGPQTLQVDDDLERGRLNRLHAVADLVHDSGGHGAPHLASFKEAPQGVAGHAEMLGCLAPSMQRRVGAHVLPDRSLKARSGVCRAVQRLCSWLRDDQSTAPIGNSPTSHSER